MAMLFIAVGDRMFLGIQDFNFCRNPNKILLN